MAQGGPPDSLNTRHERAAMLVATGLFSMKEVAEKVGLSPNRLSIIAQSPLFKVLVKRLSERIHEQTIDAAVREVMEDTRENVKFLKDARDGVVDDDPKLMQSRLRASEILFDRQVPRRQQTESEQTLTIRLDRGTVDRLDAVAIEDGGVVGGGVGSESAMPSEAASLAIAVANNASHRDPTPLAATPFETFEAEWAAEESDE